MNPLTKPEEKVKHQMRRYLSILERHLQHVLLASNLFLWAQGKVTVVNHRLRNVWTLECDEIDRSMIDEMNYIYEENPFDKERFEAINILGKGDDFGDVGYEINS